MQKKRELGMNMKKKLVLAVILGVGIMLLGKRMLNQKVLIDEFETNKIGVSHEEVENVISKALCIQYGWGSKKGFYDICTDEFVKTTDFNELYVGRRLYSIEKDYIGNLQKISGNEFEVSVQVYSPDIMIHHFTLKKIEDGKFQISDIENDI